MKKNYPNFLPKQYKRDSQLKINHNYLVFFTERGIPNELTYEKNSKKGK